MKKFSMVIILPALVLLTGCAEVLNQLAQTAGKGQAPGLSTQEIIRGLKEALVVGATNTVFETSKTDGFYKNPLIVIPFPPEAIKVKETVKRPLIPISTNTSLKRLSTECLS